MVMPFGLVRLCLFLVVFWTGSAPQVLADSTTDEAYDLERTLVHLVDRYEKLVPKLKGKPKQKADETLQRLVMGLSEATGHFENKDEKARLEALQEAFKDKRKDEMVLKTMEDVV